VGSLRPIFFVHLWFNWPDRSIAIEEGKKFFLVGFLPWINGFYILFAPLYTHLHYGTLFMPMLAVLIWKERWAMNLEFWSQRFSWTLGR
jgi:hypothetical protein